jgi:hypothetical protein
VAGNRKQDSGDRDRRRYLAAGWLGAGILGGLGVGLLTWVLLPGPSPEPAPQPRSDYRAPELAPKRPAPRPEAESLPSAPTPQEYAGEGSAGKGDGGEPAGRVALIIDDLGHKWSATEQLSSLSYPVAAAVIPHTPFAERSAERLHGAGKEVLAHLPMEPRDGSIALGEGTLLTGMARPELMATLARDLAAVPHAVGANNHMGSRLTSRSTPMDWVMAALKRRELFFVDSRTTADSRGFSAARRAGLPATRRDVFLDHDRSADAVRTQFRELVRVAKKNGTALGIGHPYPNTLAVLREELDRARAAGIEVVPVSRLIQLRRERRLALSDDNEPSNAPTGKGGAP